MFCLFVWTSFRGRTVQPGSRARGKDCRRLGVRNTRYSYTCSVLVANVQSSTANHRPSGNWHQGERVIRSHCTWKNVSWYYRLSDLCHIRTSTGSLHLRRLWNGNHNIIFIRVVFNCRPNGIFRKHWTIHWSKATQLHQKDIQEVQKRPAHQCSLTGGSLRWFAISVFLMLRTSWMLLPLTHSVATELLAIAEPQPNVLNSKNELQ